MIAPGTDLHRVLHDRLLERCRPEIARAFQADVSHTDRILVARQGSALALAGLATFLPGKAVHQQRFGYKKFFIVEVRKVVVAPVDLAKEEGRLEVYARVTDAVRATEDPTEWIHPRRIALVTALE